MLRDHRATFHFSYQQIVTDLAQSPDVPKWIEAENSWDFNRQVTNRLFANVGQTLLSNFATRTTHLEPFAMRFSHTLRSREAWKWDHPKQQPFPVWFIQNRIHCECERVASSWWCTERARAFLELMPIETHLNASSCKHFFFLLDGLGKTLRSAGDLKLEFVRLIRDSFPRKIKSIWEITNECFLFSMTHSAVKDIPTSDALEKRSLYVSLAILSISTPCSATMSWKRFDFMQQQTWQLSSLERISLLNSILKINQLKRASTEFHLLEKKLLLYHPREWIFFH